MIKVIKGIFGSFFVLNGLVLIWHILGVKNMLIEVIISFLPVLGVLNFFFLLVFLIFLIQNYQNTISIFWKVVCLVCVFNLINIVIIISPYIETKSSTSFQNTLSITYFTRGIYEPNLLNYLGTKKSDVLIFNQISRFVPPDDPSLQKNSMERLVKDYPYSNLIGNPANPKEYQNYPSCHIYALKQVDYNIVDHSNDPSSISTGRSCTHGYLLNRGALIFSKFPMDILDDEKRAIDASNSTNIFQDSYEQFGLQNVNITWMGKSVKLIIFDIGGFTDWYDKQMLDKQIYNLSNLVKSNPHTVLVGDFNAVPWSNNLNDLKNQYFPNLSNIQTGKGIQFTWGLQLRGLDRNDFIQAPIDQIFISKDFQASEVETIKSGLDHNGLEVTISTI
jgi:hypothetical protein